MWPETDRRTLRAFQKCLKSGRLAIAQKGTTPSLIDEVEQQLARHLGRDYAITTCNGSAAIVIALQALGIGPGDRVLLPALTWVGCVTSLLRVGAVPVFIDASTKESASVKYWKSGCKAVLAVHLYANQIPFHFEENGESSIPIIEDFSHCFGALSYEGRRIGQYGKISICSFQAGKVLTCGEGGVAVTDDIYLAIRMAALRADGRLRNEPHGALDWPGPVHGANYAMSEISAAFLQDQLRRLPKQCERRAHWLEDFKQHLKFPARLIGEEHVFAGGSFYGIPYRTSNPKQLLKYAEEEGVELHPIYPPIPSSPLYQPETVAEYENIRPNEEYPNAKYWHENHVLIPHEIFLDKRQPRRLASLLNNWQI